MLFSETRLAELEADIINEVVATTPQRVWCAIKTELVLPLQRIVSLSQLRDECRKCMHSVQLCSYGFNGKDLQTAATLCDELTTLQARVDTEQWQYLVELLQAKVRACFYDFFTTIVARCLVLSTPLASAWSVDLLSDDASTESMQQFDDVLHSAALKVRLRIFFL